MTYVIDTNVILVANGQHADVSSGCTAACAQRLYDVKQTGRVAIDNAYKILLEYQRKTTPSIGKGAGDAFLKWLLQNASNPQRCDQVALTEHDDRRFESFPDDPRLESFDPPDRKFVAVAAAHPDKPPILQAADSKWLDWAPALRDHGIDVEFLCPKDVLKFDNKKKGRGANGK